MSRTAHGGGPAEARYEMVAAVHARLRLRSVTKAFCNCPVDADAEANANTCPVCLGLPGALPVLNERVVERGVLAALAFGCAVGPVSEFARRHRFDPTLPKGYQITQHDRPLAARGAVQIGETTAGAPLTAAVTCAWLEEEPGRADLRRVPGATALDFNLAGAPALGLSGAPELRSPGEALAYVRALRRLARGVGASDARLGDGSLRVRATVSLRRRGDTKLGTPCVVRGANSEADLVAALDAEFSRQAALLDAGAKVERRTMRWDAEARALVPARARRGGEWGVLPEPDLPPLVLASEWLAEQRARVPARPPARREHLARAYALDGRALDVLTADPDLADYYESAARRHGDARAAADWVLGPVLDAMARGDADLDTLALRVRPADLADLLDLVREGRLSAEGARSVFGVMARTGEPARRVAARQRLWQDGDA